MKAIVYTEYGSPDVLHYKEVEKPIPKDNEVLVKVHVVSVNDWDWGLLRGKPFVNHLISGFLKPKYKILGSDIAGRVEKVGKNVKKFQPGDEVFGDLSACGWGGFAEFVCALENALALKPAAMTFDEAAAIPQAGLLALQGLCNVGQSKPGQKVLINGGGGGAGTFAIQIAKSLGAHVTGVDSTSKLDTMRSIGADVCLDYTREDFTRNGECYDLILDLAGYHSIFDYKGSLSPGGIYVMVGGSSALMFHIIFLGPLLSLTKRKKIGMLFHRPNKGLADMIKLYEDKKVVPVIDRRYMLSEVPEALGYFGQGNTKGKLIITVAPYN